LWIDESGGAGGTRSLFSHGLLGGRRRRERLSQRVQTRLGLGEAIFRLLPVRPLLERVVVMGYRLTVLALVKIGVGEIQVGIGHARVQARGLVISLDRQIELLFPPVSQAEIVIPFGTMGIELDAATQDLDRVLDSIKPVVDRS